VHGQTQPKNLLITLAVVLLATLPWVCPQLGLGRASAPATARSIVDADQDAPARPEHRTRADLRSAAPGDRIAKLRLADLDRASHRSTPGRDPWSYVDPLPRQRGFPDAPPQRIGLSSYRPPRPRGNPG
jgi:hypothetical protein